MIKAIETTYAGCRFRSRLEARWAVFFDELGIEWQYEPQGFELPAPLGSSDPLIRYLPDFWLPEQHIWFEVKGPTPSQEDISKVIALDASLDRHEARVVLAVGDIPNPRSVWESDFPIYEWEQQISMIYHLEVLGAGRTSVTFPPAPVPQESLGHFGAGWTWWARGEARTALDGAPRSIRRKPLRWRWHECRLGHLTVNSSLSCWMCRDYATWESGDPFTDACHDVAQNTPRLLAAYAAARSARFEHADREVW